MFVLEFGVRIIVAKDTLALVKSREEIGESKFRVIDSCPMELSVTNYREQCVFPFFSTS